MSKDTGGPAFPLVAETHEHVISIGVTLRDYFTVHMDTTGIPVSVGEALIGEFPAYGSPKQKQDWHARADAAYRYHRADAMLAERSKQ